MRVPGMARCIAPSMPFGCSLALRVIEGKEMIQDMIRNRWSLIGRKLQAKWNKLTDEDVNRREGNRDYLVSKLQERYGIAKERARMEVREFEGTLR